MCRFVYTIIKLGERSRFYIRRRIRGRTHEKKPNQRSVCVDSRPEPYRETKKKKKKSSRLNGSVGVADRSDTPFSSVKENQHDSEANNELQQYRLAGFLLKRFKIKEEEELTS